MWDRIFDNCLWFVFLPSFHCKWNISSTYMPNRYTLKELYNCDPKVANITPKQMYQKIIPFCVPTTCFPLDINYMPWPSYIDIFLLQYYIILITWNKTPYLCHSLFCPLLFKWPLHNWVDHCLWGLLTPHVVHCLPLRACKVFLNSLVLGARKFKPY